jgi:DNA-binding CsgD family transcriptional regulator
MTHPWLTRPRMLAVAAALQAGCGLLLLVDIASEARDYRGDPLHGALDGAILVALLLGSLLIAGEFRRLRAQNRRMETGLRAASGGFAEVLETAFAGWGLTPAEREVALLAIKGFSIAEIAVLRGAREGTVRAQCAAVYRKAGVSGRAQLLSHFIDDLVAGVDLGAAPAAPACAEPLQTAGISS